MPRVVICVQIVHEDGRTGVSEVEVENDYGPFDNLRVSALNKSALVLASAVWEARERIRVGRYK